MRIQSLLLNNIILNSKENSFREGNVLEGKIIELLGKVAIMDIKDHGIIEANLETDADINLNEELLFLVKPSEDNKVNLKPLVQEKNILYKSDGKTEEDSIMKLLKDLNIKETKESTEIVKNLMKYNIPITEKNLNHCIKTLEKLYQLLDLKEDEKVILLNPKEESVDTTGSIKNIDIKSLLVTDKNEHIRHEDISQQVKDILKGQPESSIENENRLNIPKEIKGNIEKENIVNTKDLGSTSEDIKIITFLLKNDIKASLNNIKNLREFNKDPIEFSKDFKEIDNILDKLKAQESTKGIVTSHEENSVKNIDLNRDERVSELKKIINDPSNNMDKELKEDLNKLESKIDFLKEINKDLSFVFFPIKYEKKLLDGIITLIKEDKRKKTHNNKINVFINLQTHNLGNIKVACELLRENLFIKINVRGKDLELFKSAEKHLIEKIKLIGYGLDRIEFIVDNSMGILDSIAPNPNPTYILDLKV